MLEHVLMVLKAVSLAMVVGVFVVYCAPPTAAAYGIAIGDIWVAGVGGLAWGLMAAMFWPTLRLYRLPFWWTLMLSLAAFLFTAMTVDSARMHRKGQGGLWKGRAYGGA